LLEQAVQCPSVRELSAVLDSELPMKQHVNKVASICYYHPRQLFCSNDGAM